LNKKHFLLIAAFIFIPALPFAQGVSAEPVIDSEISEMYLSVEAAKSKKEKRNLTLLLAEKLTSAGQYEEAENLYKGLLAGKPSKKQSFEYYLKLGDTAFLSKNYTLSLDYYEKARSLYKKNAEVNLKIGDVLLKCNLYNLAEKSFTEALSHDEDSYYAKKRLGDIYFEMEMYSKAVEYYGQIENAVNDKQLTVNMAVCYRNLSETDKALDIAKAYLQMTPDAEMFILSGMLNCDKKRYDSAEKDFLKSIEINGQNFMPYIYLAGIYFSADKYELAKRYIDKAYALNSSYAATDLLNAEISYKLGRIYEARRYAHNAFIKAKSPFIKERVKKSSGFFNQ
jgi:tetratricopeptide (TPR) repeat protein